MKIAILGSTGMLGSMVKRVLAQQPKYDLVCPSHPFFDVELVNMALLANFAANFAYIINCVGIIKPNIDERNRQSVERAVKVNAAFPHALAEAAERTGCRVIQIATDCVFSGANGPYDEMAAHDPMDIYGKTKSLGEVQSPEVLHLRCSIIGPELKGHRSLMDWLLGQPQDAVIDGYVNHYWNGVTTLAFARLCDGIMSKRVEFNYLPPVQHVVPRDAVSKKQLLCHIANFCERPDITVRDTVAMSTVNRSLDTRTLDMSDALWNAAGYGDPPTIEQMVEELAFFMRAGAVTE